MGTRLNDAFSSREEFPCTGLPPPFAIDAAALLTRFDGMSPRDEKSMKTRAPLVVATRSFGYFQPPHLLLLRPTRFLSLEGD